MPFRDSFPVSLEALYTVLYIPLHKMCMSLRPYTRGCVNICCKEPVAVYGALLHLRISPTDKKLGYGALDDT